jgi:hypothetical protein
MVGYERLLVNNCEIYRSIYLFILTILLIILSDRRTFQKILFDWFYDIVYLFLSYIPTWWNKI